MQTLKKYFKIYFAFLRASIIADMQYRLNYLTRFITDIFWYIAQIMMYEVIYLHTKKIGTWQIEQTRVFLGLLFVIDALYTIIFSENVDRLSEKVRKGDLDLLLAKPINSQFMISLQKVNTSILGNLIISLTWLIYSLNQLSELSLKQIAWLLVLLPCGLCIFYSFRFIFSATAVIFTKSDNLQYLWFQVYKLGMRPDSIYFSKLRFILMTIIPVSLIASVPSRILFQDASLELTLWTLIAGPLALLSSIKFWNYCLSKYSSASS